MIVGPGVLEPYDLGGDAEGAVEVLGLRFGGCGLADAEHGPVVSWQDNGADLMALEGVAAREALEGLDALAVIADNFTCAYAAGVSGTSVTFPELGLLSDRRISWRICHR